MKHDCSAANFRTIHASGVPGLAIIVLWNLILFGSVYAEKRRIEADYCVVIAASHSDEARLFESFDRFAQRQKLISWKPNGPGRQYGSADGQSEIDVAPAMPLGRDQSDNVIVFHFSMQEETQRATISELKQFIREEIEPYWDLRDCTEIEDLRLPVMIK